MKVVYFLPAHPSYFTENTYTHEEVARSISLFKFMTKPGMLGEIPEEFVFLTVPNKNTNPVFYSDGMNSPDAKTEERWTKNTLELAKSASNFHVETIKGYLRDLRKQF